jgi:cell wall-associated NlpC family hydrolase
MRTFAAVLALALALPAAAQTRQNLLETLGAELAKDRAYSPAERAALLSALETRFADYGLQVVDARRRAGVPVVLHIITEGSFDEAPPERVADVAFAAWQAMSRGAPAEAVEGIALYGYRKSIPGERIAVWANGYRQLADAKVPPDVAADLVRLTMERDIDDSTFNTLKWALVDAVKDGHDPKEYATFLFGRVAGGERPGKVSGDAKAAFRKAKREKRKVDLPPYEGVFVKTPPPPPVYEPPVQEKAEALVTVAPPPPSEKAVPSSPAVKPSAKSPPKAAPSVPTAPSKPSAPSVPSAPSTPSKPSVPPAPSSPSVAKPSAVPARPPAAPKAPVEAPAAPASAELSQVWPGVNASAHSYLGTPYVWGGTTRAGIDCSALMQNSYGENQVRLPRVSREQWKSGKKVDGSLREGDLVFFNTMGVGVSHVGLMLDPKTRRFMHASSSRGVVIDDLGKKYYSERYLGARRVVP